MSDEQLSAFDETDGGRRAGRRRKTGASFLPAGKVVPHVLLRRQESLSNGLQDKVVVVRPEILLLRDRVHKVVLKQPKTNF